MSLALGRFPALASHTLAFILGMTLARSWVQTDTKNPGRCQIPGPAEALVSLPASMQQHHWKSLKKGAALSLVRIGKRSGRPECLASDMLLKHGSGPQSKRWQVLVKTKDLEEMIRLIRHPGHLIKISPSGENSRIDLCEHKREVIYGAF